MANRANKKPSGKRPPKKPKPHVGVKSRAKRRQKIEEQAFGAYLTERDAETAARSLKKSVEIVPMSNGSYALRYI